MINLLLFSYWFLRLIFSVSIYGSVCRCVHTCICMCKWMQVLKVARSILSSGARVIGGCEPAALVAGNRTWSISPVLLQVIIMIKDVMIHSLSNIWNQPRMLLTFLQILELLISEMLQGFSSWVWKDWQRRCLLPVPLCKRWHPHRSILEPLFVVFTCSESCSFKNLSLSSTRFENSKCRTIDQHPVTFKCPLWCSLLSSVVF